MPPQERHEKLQQLDLEVKEMEKDVHREISLWTEHTDGQGNRFYFNREERQSTWTDPRPAKCQILHLKMKMLRLLQTGAGATAGFTDHKMDDPPRRMMANPKEEEALKRQKMNASRVQEGGPL